ncbi:MAG: haloacid dehalogenase type II [Gemmatimonadetes bacterium]|nr:haloacid dehalogenase type II [Gemmatimonadota bacterium]
MALSGDRSHPADQVKVRSQRHALDFERFDAITFDCYGTLIDWEAGILAALDPLLDPHGVVGRSGEELLERFARLESEAERGPFQRYRSILARVARGFGGEFGFEATSAQVEAFAASVVAWPPFTDAPPALAALGARYRLAIVSNVDDDLFAGSARQLGVDFSEVVTAQQVRSYKPAHRHFHEVLDRLDLPRNRVLHVAQSLYHDIAPARELGIACVWVNRRAGRAGSGATKASAARPDHEVPDLRTLVLELGL